MKDRIKNQPGIAQFEQVTMTEKLIQILKSRLPRSSPLYNAIHMYPKFENEVRIYTLNLNQDVAGVSLDTWIISVYTRKDITQDVLISEPDDAELTEDIKQAFLNAEFLDWSALFSFTLLDRQIALMFCEILLIKGCKAKIISFQFYYCSEKDALALDICNDDDVDVKPLDLVLGPEFMCSNWAYSVEGSLHYITQQIERNISSGVYSKKNGKPISGMLINFCGFMSMLYTEKSHRNKNYGKLCMQNLMKELVKNGFVPCSGVEIRNEPSNNFHVKIGMKPAGFVYVLRS